MVVSDRSAAMKKIWHRLQTDEVFGTRINVGLLLVSAALNILNGTYVTIWIVLASLAVVIAGFRGAIPLPRFQQRKGK